MADQKIKVVKGSVVKNINRKDLADYILAGWKAVKDNPFKFNGFEKK